MGTSLVSSILVARCLGREVYGEFGIIRGTINTFTSFAGAGLGLTANTHVAQFREADPRRVWQILKISTLFALAVGFIAAFGLLLFAPFLASKILNAPHLQNELRFGGLILLMGAINGTQVGALAGFEAFKTIALVNLRVGICSLPLYVGGAYYYGLPGAIAAFGVVTAVSCTFNHFALRSQLLRYNIPSGTLSAILHELPILWSFTLPATLAGVIVPASSWVCNAILVNQANGYSHMGAYEVASQWFNIALILPNLMGQTLIPVISERYNAGDKRSAVKVMRYAIQTNALITVPFVFLLCLLSPYLMGLYGQSFVDEWPTFIIAVMNSVVLAIQLPVGSVIAASRKMWIGFIMNLGWGITYILTTLLLANHGAFGLATARLSAYSLHAVWSLLYAISLLRKT